MSKDSFLNFLDKILESADDVTYKGVNANSPATAAGEVYLQIAEKMQKNKTATIVFSTTDDKEMQEKTDVVINLVLALLTASGAVYEYSKANHELKIHSFTAAMLTKVSEERQFNPTVYGCQESHFDKTGNSFEDGICLRPIDPEREHLIVLNANPDLDRRSCVYSLSKGHHHMIGEELRQHYMLTEYVLNKSGMVHLLPHLMSQKTKH